MDVTPTWWEWRQQQADLVPFDYEQMRAMADAHREQEQRFLALFRRPPGGEGVSTTS